MVQDGSVKRATTPLPVGLAVASALLGIGAMHGLSLTAPSFLARLNFRAVLVVAELVLVVPTLLLVALRSTPAATTLGLAWQGPRLAGLAAGVGASLWLASLGLLELQYWVWAPPEGYLELFRRLHELLRPKGPLDFLVSVFAIAIAPAACEELLVRGALLPSLLRWLGSSGAVVASSVVFASMHLDSYRWPFTFAVGLALGALRLRTGSVLPTMLAHATLNTLTFVAAPFLDDPNQPLPDPRPLMGAVLFALGSLVAAALWRHMRQDEAIGRLP